MKVLMTTDTVGGVWQYSLDLSESLREDQVDVVLLSMGPKPSNKQLEQVHNVPNLEFHHLSCKLEWMNEPWGDVKRAGNWIKDKVKETDPELLHFNNFGHVNMHWDLPVVLVAHSCIATWWKDVKKTALPKRFEEYYETVKQAFHRADVVVTPTKAILKCYEEVYGEIHNSRIIYNALGNFPKSEREKNKERIIFSMGRLWDEAKNIKLLVKAADKVDAQIYIAGDKQELLLESDNVTFLGKLGRNEIFQWLEKSSVYVLPVKYEPFGLSFIEAASQKCALIGGDISTLREIWGENMLYVDPEDEKDVAQKCNKLLYDTQLRKEFGEKAFVNSKRFLLEKKKEQYLELYKNLILTRTQKQSA